MTAKDKATVGTWVSAECKAKLEALAAARGVSLSEMLKTVIVEQLLTNEAAFESVPTKGGGDPRRQVKVRLTETEFEALEALAQTAAMSRQRLLVGLIRSAVAGEPLVTGPETTALLDSAMQLKKMGININQIAHVLNEERLTQKFKGDELAQFFPLAEALCTRIESVAGQVADVISQCRNRCLIRKKSKATC